MELPGAEYQTARYDAGRLKGAVIINVVAYGGGTNNEKKLKM